jgi:hypothetical protein
MKRIAVREAVGRFRAENPRVFGSVLHGTGQDGSDIDLLVDALPGATLFDLGHIQQAATDACGFVHGAHMTNDNKRYKNRDVAGYMGDYWEYIPSWAAL